MLRVDPKETATKDMHQFLLGAVAPRPIAWASTISKNGVANIAPYSFFNCFSSNPPILIFSSNRRVIDNSTKDTLKNIEDTGEVVINVVSHHLVRQMALTSVNYPDHISEFDKAGLTPLASETIKPFRVAESHVQMECKVKEIISLGDKGGAGNLIVCHVQMMHVNEDIMTGNRIDPQKIDLMGRMGRMWYARAKGRAIQEVVQPVAQIGVGFDALPDGILNSSILRGNHLAALAALTSLPSLVSAQKALKNDLALQGILEGNNKKTRLHRYIKQCIKNGEVEKAAQIAILAAS